LDDDPSGLGVQLDLVGQLRLLEQDFGNAKAA
jgi:hypothetical protein